MRSRVLRSLMTLAAVALATACGGRRLPAPGEPITLVLKHAKHPQHEVLAGIIAEFEAAHPGLRVRREILPASSDDQHQFYVINLAAGSDDFDVLDMDIIWVPEFARAGWLAPLTGAIPDDELAALHRQAVRADWLAGDLYGVPWFVDTGVLYYRRDLLDRYGFDPPETYEALAAQARRILDAEDDPRLAGFIWQGMQYEGLVVSMLEFIRGHGGRILADPRAPALNDPATLAALRYVERLMEEGVTPRLVTTMTEEPARQMFQAGRAIFMRNWPYAWPLLNAEDSPVAGKVGQTQVPHFEGYSSAPTLGGYHLGVNARSPHRAEAIAFLRFMIGVRPQTRVLLEMGRLPAHRGPYRDPAVQAAVPYVTELLPSLELAQPRPVSPYYLMLSQILQPELSAIVAGIRPPAQSMALAARQIERLLVP